MSALRIFGIVMVGVGLFWAVFPSWLAGLSGVVGPAADTFAAIERRVRGGMVLGIGLLLVVRTEWRPWSTTLASAVFYFVFGALFARVLGLMFEGPDGRQWLWVAGEALVIALAAVALWRFTPGG